MADNRTTDSDDPARSKWGSVALGLTLLGAMALRSGERAGSAKLQLDPAPDEHRVLATDSTTVAASGASPPDTGRWYDVFWRLYRSADRDRVMLVAAGVTYYALLALFPALAAFVALYGLFADPAAITIQLAGLRQILPEGAIDIIGTQIAHIQQQGGRTLGVTFFVALAASLYSANAGMKALFEALNIVYGETEKRSFLWYNVQALLFTLGAIAFVILAVSAVVVMPAVFAFVGLESVAGTAISVSRWPVLLLLALVFLALLYRYGPSRKEPRWRWVTWGSTIAAVVWLTGSMAFSWYVANFPSFNETYGSLGAAIGFMVWIWLSALIVLIGGEINADIERRARR